MTRASVSMVAALAAVLAAQVDLISARQSQTSAERPPAGPTVDFIALDADGSPVNDLQSSEIEIRIANQVRAVRTLRRVSAVPPLMAEAQSRVPPPYGTNSDAATGRRFILIIDQESFQAGGDQLFRGAIEGLLNRLTPADRTMVAALPFGGVAVPFTSDVARIRLAVGRVAGQAPQSETGSDLACRTRRFLETLQAQLQQLGTATAPQTLILFTAGMAAPRRDAPMGMQPGMCELRVDQFRLVASAASAARTNVYVMQPADIGIRTSLPRPTQAGDRGSDNPLEGIEHLAGVTGGARLPLDATGTESLLRVVKESSAYYVAELEPVRDEVFGRSRRLGVRVTRRGVTLRVRPEIILVNTAPVKSTRLTVPDILSSTNAVTDLPLRVGAFTVRDSDGKLRLGVLIEPVDDPRQSRRPGPSQSTATTACVTHWYATDATERPLLGAMPVPPGTYRVRAAAIDTMGRSGAAEADIDASLIQVGALSLGSLLLSASRGGVVALQLEFGSEATARASFDIYGGAADQQLSAKLEVARDLDGPAITTVPVALTRADETRVIATGAIPLGALAPGDYVVRGAVRLEDGTTGRVVRTLRKVAK